MMLWLLLYVFSVSLLSSLLAPPLYFVIDHLWPHVFPFRRIFNRAFVISIPLALLPWMKYWGILNLRRLGLIHSGWWKSLFLGCSLGLISLAPFLLANVFFGFRQWQVDLPPEKLAEILGSSFLVGLLEETIFRGALLHAQKDYIGRKTLLWAFSISIIFGAAHFVQGSDLHEPVSFFSGFNQWDRPSPHFENPEGLIRLFCLIGVGFSLSCLTLRTSTLWPAIGLHMGWVIIMRLSDRLTTNPTHEWSIWFGQDIGTGIPVLIFLILLSILFLRIPEMCES